MTTSDDAVRLDDVDSTSLDAQDHGLARLLARGFTYDDAGEVLGLSKSTVYRRMQDPAMRRAVDAARAIGVEVVLARITAAAELAATFLAEVVEDENRPDALRVRAASDLLSHLIRWESLPRSTCESKKQLDDALAELESMLLGGAQMTRLPD
jgi:hypothetical protein